MGNIKRLHVRPDNEELVYTVNRNLEERGLIDQIREKGNLIFLAVTGAHSYGFPSKDSDYDIRGVYVTPTEELLGLDDKRPERHVDYMSEDKQIDISLDEVGKYLGLVSKSNGNRVEWPNSIVFYESEDFEGLRDIINTASLSKDLYWHYLNFADNLWNGGKGKTRRVKTDLYALRLYMTGIKILEDGEVSVDINELNEHFDIPIIERMLLDKVEEEIGGPVRYDRNELIPIIRSLNERLTKSYEYSELPERADIDKINRYLKELRIEQMEGRA